MTDRENLDDVNERPVFPIQADTALLGLALIVVALCLGVCDRRSAEGQDNQAARPQQVEHEQQTATTARPGSRGEDGGSRATEGYAEHANPTHAGAGTAGTQQAEGATEGASSKPVAATDTALVIARCVADEVGPDLPAAWADHEARIGEQVSVMWALHNGWRSRVAKEPDLTLADHARQYCALYVKHLASRAWLRELPADGHTKPESFPARDRWSEYAPRWRALLARVRVWLGPCGAELVLHWNSPGSKARGRMQVARCSRFGPGRNVLFVVLTPRQARAREYAALRERVLSAWKVDAQVASVGGPFYGERAR